MGLTADRYDVTQSLCLHLSRDRSIITDGFMADKVKLNEGTVHFDEITGTHLFGKNICVESIEQMTIDESREIYRCVGNFQRIVYFWVSIWELNI